MEDYNSEVPGDFEKAAYDLQMETSDENNKNEPLQQTAGNIPSSADQTFTPNTSVQDTSVINAPFDPQILPGENQSLSNINQELTSINPQLSVESEMEQLHSISDSVVSIVNTNEINENVDKMDWTNIAEDNISNTKNVNFLDNDNLSQNLTEVESTTQVMSETVDSHSNLNNVSQQIVSECSSISNLTPENSEVELEKEKSIVDVNVSSKELSNPLTENNRMDICDTETNIEMNSIIDEPFSEPESSRSEEAVSQPKATNQREETITQPDEVSDQSDTNVTQPDGSPSEAEETQSQPEETTSQSSETEKLQEEITPMDQDTDVNDKSSVENDEQGNENEKLDSIESESVSVPQTVSEPENNQTVEQTSPNESTNPKDTTNNKEQDSTQMNDLTEIQQTSKETETDKAQNKEQEKPHESVKNRTDNDITTSENSVLGGTFESNENIEGADAELTIIPDTQREISQAEKDAASSIPPLRDLTEASASTENEVCQESITPDQSTGVQIVVYKHEKEELQKCNQCKLQRKVKYHYSIDEDTKYLCDDNCLNSFKNGQTEKVIFNWEEGGLRVKNFTGNKEPPSLSFIRKCAACKKVTNDIENNLTWEIMDFCNELCLTKYQKEIGSRCSSCQGEVKSNSLGKYCVRFGNDIRQFCTSTCLEKYKKGLKVCSYCQQDMSGGPKGFLAPVGDKGQFKDFCSQLCMDKYDIMTNDRPPAVPTGTLCSVCKTEKQITIEFELDGAPNHFCGEPCFVAFSFVNNISPGKCAMCRRHFSKTTLEKFTMFYDNVQYSFCSNSCENIYIIAHRKIVPCSWCKVKKYNFDMIRRYSKDGSVINMCSVNCLSLYRVSVNAVNSRQTVCNYCQKVAHPMYHLTMSDATVRNFCSYNCVMTFQGQFPKQPIIMNNINDSYPVPTGAPRKNKRYTGGESGSALSEVNAMPIVANVQSLATNGTHQPSKSIPPSLTPITTRTTRSKSAGTGPQILNSTQPVLNSFSDLPFQLQIKQHFIVRPAPIPEQKNVATMCYTRKCNKSITAKAEMVDQGIQTDEREASKILIPVPVPIFVPTPMHMYSAPTPVPVPFPVPIPVPIFIPTTRNSAAGIMKEIKKIQVKIPTDPYEAEILMMAEMVAEEKKEETTDSESDVDDTGGPEDSYSPEPVDASNTFGDDMLQMALKMATELDEPAVDLEGALTANTITAPQGPEGQTEEAVDDPQPMHQHLLERSPSVRGRKRGMRQSRGGGAKRGRRMSHHQVDMPMMQAQMPQPAPQPEPQEKPDANMCLKYTFGVNAWKQWVTTKNAELEKSRRVKLFKTEILQLTSDELNYSLCLFVKEVRKPNGAEYAPDTIYYLCLGIQQYLFENGRIDNIFCDLYYEKFTDCLDEVAKKFSVLYNDSHYIVTRVEEEHLWESKQLGAHSPHVLLSTLMFFNTKHFNLTSVDEHMQLSFSHIMKHWKRNPNQPGGSKAPSSRNVLLRFYPPQSAIQNNARKKKVYEQQENEENPLRCPVKLYEFYLSKCPESVKTRNDVFYLQPERSCVPDSPVWYSAMPLPREALEKMLHRVKMVKEINVALLTS